jgi:HD-GYP domain-containing protein (c-di-GMP phosphodiesterase class II)
MRELTEELERAKAIAEAATPAQQVTKMLRAVEPIAFTLSIDSILKNFAEMAGRLVNAQAVQIFLWEERDEKFRLAFCTAPSHLGKAVSVSFRMGEGLAGYCAERMELVQAEDVTKDDHFSKTIDEVPGVLSRAVIAGPLAANGRLVGVVEALNRKDGQPFSSEDGVALAGLALLGAAALEKAITHAELGETARAALAAVADTVETRSAEAEGGRANRIRQMAVALADSLGFKPKDLRDLEWASLLYNTGKITIPPEVATARGDLLPKDRELLLNAPRVSAERLGSHPALASAARIMRHVNERWDGMGVPDRQSGEGIPWGARVLAVVDAFEGLTGGGPGSKAVPADVALKEIESCSGKQFDPACVEAFLRLARSSKWRAAG